MTTTTTTIIIIKYMCNLFFKEAYWNSSEVFYKIERKLGF